MVQVFPSLSIHLCTDEEIAEYLQAIDGCDDAEIAHLRKFLLFRFLDGEVLSAVRADGFLLATLGDKGVSAFHAGGVSVFQPVRIEVHGIVIAPLHLSIGGRVQFFHCCHNLALKVVLGSHSQKLNSIGCTCAVCSLLAVGFLCSDILR